LPPRIIMSDSKPQLKLVADNTLTEDSDPIADGRESLQLIVSGQRDLAQLDDRLAALEVECIEADMAASQCARDNNLKPLDVVRIGTVLARQRALGSALSEYEAEPQDDDRDAKLRQLTAATQALSDWLHAPELKESKRTATLARIVMLMAVIIVGWFAWVLHWVVLVLLIPVVGPLSAMLHRGENTMWRRAGMRQRFEQSGLPVTHAWEGEPVAQHLAELEAQLKALEAREPRPAMPAGEPVQDERYTELTYESLDVELALERLGEETGFDTLGLNTETCDTLVHAAKLAGARQRLTTLRQECDALKRDVETRKDGIFRMLSAAGVAPEGGRADVASLSEGLTQMEHIER
jgi:hypothetical protein